MTIKAATTLTAVFLGLFMLGNTAFAQSTTTDTTTDTTAGDTGFPNTGAGGQALINLLGLGSAGVLSIASVMFLRKKA